MGLPDPSRDQLGVLRPIVDDEHEFPGLSHTRILSSCQICTTTYISENPEISELTTCDRRTVLGASRLNLFLDLSITSELVLPSACVEVPMSHGLTTWDRRTVPMSNRGPRGSLGGAGFSFQGTDGGTEGLVGVDV